jgi:hypothetical protein
MVVGKVMASGVEENRAPGMEMWKSHCAFWWGVLRCGAVAGEPFILRFPTPAKSMACVHVKRKRCLVQDIIRILIFQYLVLLYSTRLGAKLFNTDEKIATQTLAHQNHLGTIPSRVQTFCHPVQLLQERVARINQNESPTNAKFYGGRGRLVSGKSRFSGHFCLKR